MKKKKLETFNLRKSIYSSWNKRINYQFLWERGNFFVISLKFADILFSVASKLLAAGCNRLHSDRKINICNGSIAGGEGWVTVVAPSACRCDIRTVDGCSHPHALPVVLQYANLYVRIISSICRLAATRPLLRIARNVRECPGKLWDCSFARSRRGKVGSRFVKRRFVVWVKTSGRRNLLPLCSLPCSLEVRDSIKNLTSYKSRNTRENVSIDLDQPDVQNHDVDE